MKIMNYAHSSLRCGVATLFTEEMHAKRPAEAPMDPVLTPRLVLTPVGPDDVNDLLLLHSDPVVGYWTGPWTRAAVEAWAADMAARWTADGVGKWMARDRSDGSLVGRGGFTRVDLDGETVLELGWAVRDARTGRGYATELGRAALAWAVEHQPDLPVVACTTVPRGRSWTGSGCDQRASSDVRDSSRAAPACTRTPPSLCTDSEIQATSSTRPAVRRLLGSLGPAL
jgi:RimJ/RimL family protein N-acetyltransferase